MKDKLLERHRLVFSYRIFQVNIFKINIRHSHASEDLSRSSNPRKSASVQVCIARPPPKLRPRPKKERLIRMSAAASRVPLQYRRPNQCQERAVSGFQSHKYGEFVISTSDNFTVVNNGCDVEKYLQANFQDFAWYRENGYKSRRSRLPAPSQ